MSKHRKMYINSNQLVTINPIGENQQKVFDAWAKDKNLFLTGSAGSNRIRSAIIQIVINHLCHGLDIEAATGAPRIPLEGNGLRAEPGVDEGELEELEGRYEVDRWQEQNLFFGGANSVTPVGGAGDPRRSGAAIII